MICHKLWRPLLGNEPETDAEGFYEYINVYLGMIREFFIHVAEKGDGIVFWLI